MRATILTLGRNARLREGPFLTTQTAVRFNPLFARLSRQLVEAGKPNM